MGRVSPPLLVQGNGKLSAGIWHFSIPPVSTCPGRTSLCERACYSRVGRFSFPAVKKRMEWNYRQSLREDFVDRMVDEIYRSGVMVLRIHVSGDFGTPQYARKWLEIVRRSPHAMVFAYTRSYRVPQIASVLADMANLENLRLWYSADAEASPTEIPKNVRVAWMQTRRDEIMENADLVFRVRSLRKTELPVLPVCPQETPDGKEKGTTCATCRICWK